MGSSPSSAVTLATSTSTGSARDSLGFLFSVGSALTPVVAGEAALVAGEAALVAAEPVLVAAEAALVVAVPAVGFVLLN